MPSSSNDREVAPPLIPIVIGVTGKRELGGSEKEDHVRESLQTEFGSLEKRFPNSPLVLITGLTKGADLLAADVALKQPTKRWTVVGLLPFAKELFLEDFREADPRWRAKFEEVTRPGERFLLKELKPLRKPSDARDRHYEQVGFAVADRCSLLIAVMPKAEEDDKNSGTARILRYKRDGKLDATAREIADASEEIAPPEPIDGPITGVVWILDPDPKEPTRKDNQHYARMTLDRIEAYNRRVRQSRAAEELPAAPKLFEAATADDYLTRLRRELSTIQGRAKSRLSRSTWGLAGLLIASIAVLEIYAKVLRASWLVSAYAFIGLTRLAVAYRSNKQQLQAYAEDYRAAAEAMRVQVEWWRLGLRGPKHRVDRYYLVGGEGHFAVLRSGIKAVIDAALLLDRKPASGGQPLEVENKYSWIPGQIHFFERRSDSRHRTAIRWSSLAWYLFQISIGIGFGIAGLILLREFDPSAQTRVVAIVRTLASEYRQWLPMLGLAAVLWAVLFLVWVRVPQLRPPPAHATVWQRMYHWLRYRGVLGTRGRHSGKHGWVVALPLGALMVLSVLAYIADQDLLAASALQKTEGICLVLMIVLAAASEAVHSILERSALEAEAVTYRETLQRFLAARDRALEARSRPGADAAAILEADQKLGLELGRVALAENEAWLRAHRQRPFEPVP